MIGRTEMLVLCALAEHYDQWYDISFVNFQTLIYDTGLDRKSVRRACRSLKRKGYARFKSGLWSEDDRPAGSGYAASKEGVELADKIQAARKA